MAEERMFRFQFRGSIAAATVVVALLSSRPADAQVGVDPGPPREPGGLCNNVITGAEYDIINKALAEKHLQKLEAKLRSDAERGDMAAVEHDARRIDNLKYRIAIDDWLIHWNTRQYPCFYPIRTDPVSLAAIAQAATPTQVPNPQRPVPTMGLTGTFPTISVTIVNAERAGAGVAFAIDGATYQAPPGSRQDLAVPPNSNISYDDGGSRGQRLYRIGPGVYEFRLTAEGWALYKLSGLP
jgi:hypothetical protein